MSSVLVEVKTIDAVHEHPNADNLAIAEVGGWQFVTQKSGYKAGDKVVYFPPDTVLPGDVAEELGVARYLDKGRIKAIKLRGEPSFGLVVPPADPTWPVGLDVAEHYGAKKWEPPAREFTGRNVGGQQPLYSDALPENPMFNRYTDIENLRHYKTLFNEGEPVYVSEKVHGTSCRIGIVDGEWQAGCGKGRQRKPLAECVYPDSAWYWFPRSIAGVDALLTDLARHNTQAILYGEVYGSGVQSLNYGLAQGKIAFAAFDLMINGVYLNGPAFREVMASYDIPVVPSFGYLTYNFEKIRDLANGPTTLGATHIREGVVVKPLTERNHPKVGRLVLKYVSDAYLTGKQTDFKEE
jgi:RNA ligase (TIGR02306 family)